MLIVKEKIQKSVCSIVKLSKPAFNIILDILAGIIAISGAIFLFIIGSPKERILLLAIIFLIMGYIFIKSRIIPKEIMINNMKKETAKRDEFEKFIEKEDKTGDFYTYLKSLQENLKYEYTIPESYGLKKEKRFITKNFNYIKIPVQINNLYDIKTTVGLVTNGEEIEKIMLNYNNYIIYVTIDDITMQQKKVKKDENIKELNEEEVKKYFEREHTKATLKVIK
mgnify:CR=1 FL=1